MKTKINRSDEVSKLEASSMRSIMGGYEYCLIYACEGAPSSNNYIATYLAHKNTNINE